MYDRFFEEKIKDLKDRGQYRDFVTLNRIRGEFPIARLASDDTGETVIIWCSNDYLGMSQHPGAVSAAKDAIVSFGVGSGGSRNIGGTHRDYVRLESSLAELHQKEASLVFPTGYSSNDATLQCLLRLLPDIVVFSDALNHASIINGLRSSAAEKRVFRHNDLGHLEALLDATPTDRPKLIVFESIYSMDGDRAPIREIVALAQRYRAMTYLDEVHAVGIYGPRGAGLAADLGVANDVDIIQGTMAKAFGVIGGYIAGRTNLVDSIRSHCSGFIFTTSLPPSTVAACLHNVEYLQSSSFEREALQTRTLELRNAFSCARVPIMDQSTTHILPVLVGDAEKCKLAAARLLSVHRVYLQPINSPTVPVGTERFRVNVTPNHTISHIHHLAEAMAETFKSLSIPLARKKMG